MSTKVEFDQIAEVTCLDCDWFGMRDDLKKGSGSSSDFDYCPECKSDNLEYEDGE